MTMSIKTLFCLSAAGRWRTSSEQGGKPCPPRASPRAALLKNPRARLQLRLATAALTHRGGLAYCIAGLTLGVHHGLTMDYDNVGLTPGPPFSQLDSLRLGVGNPIPRCPLVAVVLCRGVLP